MVSQWRHHYIVRCKISRNPMLIMQDEHAQNRIGNLGSYYFKCPVGWPAVWLAMMANIGRYPDIQVNRQSVRCRPIRSLVCRSAQSGHRIMWWFMCVTPDWTPAWPVVIVNWPGDRLRTIAGQRYFNGCRMLNQRSIKICFHERTAAHLIVRAVSIVYKTHTQTDRQTLTHT